jgi:hypothetical protein
MTRLAAKVISQGNFFSVSFGKGSQILNQFQRARNCTRIHVDCRHMTPKTLTQGKIQVHVYIYYIFLNLTTII